MDPKLVVYLRRKWGGGGCDLVPTLPGYVCPKVKDRVPFQSQVGEMNENISLKVSAKLDVIQ